MYQEEAAEKKIPARRSHRNVRESSERKAIAAARASGAASSKREAGQHIRDSEDDSEIRQALLGRSGSAFLGDDEPITVEIVYADESPDFDDELDESYPLD